MCDFLFYIYMERVRKVNVRILGRELSLVNYDDRVEDKSAIVSR